MDFIWPMLLGKSEPFSDESYLFEWKMDGIRLELVHTHGKGTQLYTRHKTNCTHTFPEIRDLPFSHSVILDGELIVYNPETGRDDFELVLQRFQMNNEFNIRMAVREIPCTLMVFDILQLDGASLLQKPLIERKALLNEVIEQNEYLHIVDFIEGAGEAFYQQIVQFKLEGCIAKAKESRYYPGVRSQDDWLKIVRYEYFDVLITGYRKDKFGLLCSFLKEEGGRMQPAGTIELTDRNAREKVFLLGVKGKEDRLNVYFKEGIQVTVKSRGLTKRGYLRNPYLVKIER